MLIDRPIAVDLFAGAGGLSLGFEQGGFDVLAAVEIDPVHAAVHEFNFPNSTVLARSVVGLTGREIRERAGIGKREIAVVVGGAPCQGFSLIGQRVLDDPRNSLVREYVRIVRELKPRYFVFENVKGLTLGAHRRFLEELIEEFSNFGYRVRLPWRVLNAVDYGVPQHRERLFIVGARRGERLPEYPPETTFRADRDPVLGRECGPTVSDALGDLPNADKFPELVGSDEVATADWAEPSEYARILRCRDADGWHFGYRRKFDPSVLTSSIRTNHSAISRGRFSATVPGSVEPYSRFLRLHPRGVSNTLRAGSDASRGAFTSPRPIHYKFRRVITVREMARLHGFPDWFRFHATKWHGAREIGNSVAPPVARAIALELAAAMDYRPSRPRLILPLGETELLHLDQAGASAHFGLTFEASRRDRRSEFRKRSQSETEAERLATL
jgi:DNA (cytosine-5)-methyltransferase 1